MADATQLVNEYLQETILMQLATTDGTKPWACTVHYVPDERPNFYWLSRPDRRHSEELSARPQVAGVIVKPHEKGEPPRGLQFEGVAEAVSEGELKLAKTLYKDRFGFDEFAGHVFYVARPSRIVLFDRVNFPDDPQQEVLLK